MQYFRKVEERTEQEILEFLEDKISNLIVYTNNWKYLYYLDEYSKNNFFIDDSKDKVDIEEKIICILKEIRNNKLTLDFYYQIIDYINAIKLGGVSIIKEDSYSIGFVEKNKNAKKIEEIIKNWKNIFDVMYLIVLKTDLTNGEVSEDKIETPLNWIIKLLEENKGTDQQFNLIYNIGIFSEMSLKIRMSENINDIEDGEYTNNNCENNIVDAIGIKINNNFDYDDDENWDL